VGAAETAPRPFTKDKGKPEIYGLSFKSFIVFLSFISHESPQQPSCFSEDMLAAPLVFAAPAFMSHESPQQHPSLSDAIAWFFMLVFFISHESPQQPQHPFLSDELT
jgi:hypothetical protein